MHMQVSEVPANAVQIQPQAAPAKVPTKRYFHLDALKGVMILWGIPVHASTIGTSSFFDDVAEISGWVRMEAFFIISGFLSYMLIKRYGAKPIMRRRLTAVGIPMLSVLILLNPLTNYLILKYHNGTSAPGFTDFITGHVPAGMNGTWNWHLHVWFLGVLLCLAATFSTTSIRWMDATVAWLRPKLGKLPGVILLLVAAGVVAGVALAARIGYEAAVKPFVSESFHFPLRAIGYYAGFYCFGMLMFASPRLFKTFHRFNWVQIVAAGFLLWGAREIQPQLPDKAGEGIRLLAEVYAGLMFSSLLFAIFERLFSKETPVMKFIAESAFTVYLFHYLVIYLAAFAIRPYLDKDYQLMLGLLVTLATTVVTMLGYEFFICRSPAFRALFLGKFSKQAVPEKVKSGAPQPAATVRGRP
jgi:glucan biosynthesis protein C